MTYFSEVFWSSQRGGRITKIIPGSVAADIGLQTGDILLAINEHPVDDVIDVQFYAAEESLELLIRRADDYVIYEAERDYGQQLGLEFEHPTFDTDIRRCNNLCEFCFVLQMAPHLRRTLYIKDDDYRYSFLFGHYVTLTNLSEHDWWRIETMGLSPLYVSVHVTDLEMRRKFLRNPNAPDIIKQLRWLADREIELHTQLVIVPDFNDGAWLESSIEELANLWPAVRSVSVVPVGLTKYHKYGMRTHTRQEARSILEYVELQQPKYLERFGKRFVYPTDEWYLTSDREVPPLNTYDDLRLHENGLGMVRAFLDDWEIQRGELVQKQNGDGLAWAQPSPSAYRTVTLVTGTMFASTLEKAAAELFELTGYSAEVLSIRNTRLGETITAAGLLMGEDILDQLSSVRLNDLIILPKVAFDHPGTMTLDNITAEKIASDLDRPVALAVNMGDVLGVIKGIADVLYKP